MNMEECLKKLKKPFSFEEIDWKVQMTNKERTQGMAVPYLNSLAIQNRLDEVIGAMNWTNEFMLWQEKAQICGIGLYDQECGAWLMKCDGAENTDIEPGKGGLSDSFKRAVVLWGIGRYLYDMDSIWVAIKPSGKSSRIKKEEFSKLRKHYESSVARLMGATAKPQSGQAESAPKAVPDDSSQEADYDYVIKATSDSGSSVCLKLANKEGKEVAVYARRGDARLSSGAKLRNVKFEKKKAEFGIYFTMPEYEVAA